VAKKPTRLPSFTASTFVVCDDVREEKSGKMILIGVYNDAAIVKAFPAIMLKLVFRFSGILNVDNAKEVRFQIIDNEGKERAAVQAALPPTLKRGPNNFMFEMHGAAFEKPTLLSVYFGVDSPQLLAGTFEIRGAQTDEEEARMSS
jgi:hypothetical protein